MSTDDRREDLAGAGAALFRLVRFWSRRWLMGAGEETGGERRRIQGIAVLEAVEIAAREGKEVSIADVAHELGLDHSGASRFVAAAVAEEHLARSTSDTDSRRAVLTVTDAGREILTGSHAWQESVYEALVADWDPADAARLADYLRRLAAEVGEPD